MMAFFRLINEFISKATDFDYFGVRQGRRNVKVETYPLGYVEIFTLKSDDVATQKTMKDLVLLMNSLITL